MAGNPLSTSSQTITGNPARRIISLHPAATEWVTAFGARDRLIGRSHACNHPPSVLGLPSLTRSSISPGTSARIDDAVRSRAAEGTAPFEIDLNELIRLEPDLILTQNLCDSCSTAPRILQQLLDDRLRRPTEIFAFGERSLKGVLDEALRLGRRLGCFESAMSSIAARERDLMILRHRIASVVHERKSPAPSVLCIEWMDPIMTAGNWVPDVVEQAGGRAVCTTPAEASKATTWTDVLDANPDVIAIMPCGLSVEDAGKEIHALTRLENWEQISAVRSGRVFLFDGEAYFNRPGPRLYRSIELLAFAFHGLAPYSKPEPWEIRRIRAASTAAK